MRVSPQILSLALLIGLFFGPLSVSGTETEGGEKTAQVITGGMVWNADRQAVHLVRQRCGDLDGRQMDECFVNAMKDLGASESAVSFVRSFGNGTFVKRFREVGRTGIAHIVHPFRPTDPVGILLVNGDPPIIDVDEITALPRESMEQDKVYGAIKKSYPKVGLWQGDRSPKYPLVEPLPDGGYAFTFPYALRNSCHVCEVVGTAFFAFDFGRNGRLKGIRFVKTEQLPKKTVVKADSRRESEQIRFIVMTEEGKEFTVKLDSNRATGYQWRPAAPLDERILKLSRSEYVPLETGVIGAGGEESWTFSAVGKGEAEVVMEYVRPWEKGQAAVKTATVKVTVRPANQR